MLNIRFANYVQLICTSIIVLFVLVGCVSGTSSNTSANVSTQSQISKQTVNSPQNINILKNQDNVAGLISFHLESPETFESITLVYYSESTCTTEAARVNLNDSNNFSIQPGNWEYSESDNYRFCESFPGGCAAERNTVKSSRVIYHYDNSIFSGKCYANTVASTQDGDWFANWRSDPSGNTPCTSDSCSMRGKYLADNLERARYAYSINSNSTISIHNLDLGTGNLDELAARLVESDKGSDLETVVVEPSKRFAYAMSPLAEKIFMYSITESGFLDSLGLKSIPLDKQNAQILPVSITVDPQGKYLYAYATGFIQGRHSQSIQATKLYTFSINQSNGLLTPTSSVAFDQTTESFPIGYGGDMQINHFGNYIYVTNNFFSHISAFKVNQSDGLISQIGVADIAESAHGSKIAISNSGKYVYVSNLEFGTITMFKVDSDSGNLTRISSADITVDSYDYVSTMAVTPTDKYLYVADFGVDHLSPSNIYMYSIDESSGVLMPLNTAFVPNEYGGGGQMVIDPSGQYVYSNDFQESTVAEFKIDQDSGILTPIGHITNQLGNTFGIGFN